MTFKYKIGLEDFVAFQRYFWKTDTSMRRLRMTLLVAVPFVLLCMLLYTRIDAVSIIAMVVITGLWIVLSRFFVNLSIGNAAKRYYKNRQNSSTFAQREVEVDPDLGIFIRTGSTDTRIGWQNIVKIAETKEHYFVFTNTHVGHIIPKRAVAASDKETLRRLFIEHTLFIYAEK